MKLPEGKQIEYFKWIIFALAIYVIYRLLNRFGLFDKTVAETEAEQSKAEVSEETTQETIKKIQAKKPYLKATLTGMQYVTIANNLYQALKGWTEDESLIYREFLKLNNDIDMVTLLNVYGTRKIPSDVWFRDDFTGTLSEAINKFLNDTEIALLNNMLAKKGITHRF